MAIKFTHVVDVANQRITSVGSPSVGTDAVNKDYVDNVAQGLNWKQAARAAATGNVDIAAPGATMDGVTLAADDRVLLFNQVDQSENGIYVFGGAAAPLVRADDANTEALLTSATVSIAEGTVNGDLTYVLTTNPPFTVDTDPLVWGLMNGGTGATYVAGNGLDLTGGAFSVKPVGGGGLTVSAGGVSLDPAVAVRKFAANVGDGASTAVSVTHNLGTLDVVVELYTNAAPYDTVYAEVQRADINTVTLVFGTAPAAAAYRVVVHG